MQSEKKTSAVRPYALALIVGLATVVAACSPADTGTDSADPIDNVFVGDVAEPTDTVVEPTPPPPNVLQFVSGADATAYLAEGWSSPEGSFTWTLGNTSEIVIPEGALSNLLPEGEGEGAWQLNLRMWAFLAGTHTDQNVDIFANGELLRSVDFSFDEGGADEQLYTVDLGDAWTPADPLSLTFEIENPRSPAELEVNSDERALGIALASISFDQVAPE